MPIVNTTSGLVEVEPRSHRHVNTSRIVEEDMVYEDEEPEILSVLPATGWHAVLGDTAVPLVAFVALDSGTMYGVAVGDDGCIDLANSVDEQTGFSRYEQVTQEKE